MKIYYKKDPERIGAYSAYRCVNGSYVGWVKRSISSHRLWINGKTDGFFKTRKLAAEALIK